MHHIYLIGDPSSYFKYCVNTWKHFKCFHVCNLHFQYGLYHNVNLSGANCGILFDINMSPVIIRFFLILKISAYVVEAKHRTPLGCTPMIQGTGHPLIVHPWYKAPDTPWLYTHDIRHRTPLGCTPMIQGEYTIDLQMFSVTRTIWLRFIPSDSSPSFPFKPRKRRGALVMGVSRAHKG